jgi:hypothetical protein
MMETTLTLSFPFIVDGEEDEVEAQVEIEWDGEPDTPGCRSGHPDNWTPDEAGYTDITCMTLVEDIPELNLKAGAIIESHQVTESDDDIERRVVEGYDPGDDFDEPDDYDDYDDPAHDYIYDPGY